MVNLDVEIIRHLKKERFLDIRDQNITPDLFNLSEEKIESEERLVAQSVLSWFYNYWNETRKIPGFSTVLSEFPILDDPKYQEDPETDIEYLTEKLRVRYSKNEQRRQLLALAQATPEEFAELYVQGSRKIYQVMSGKDFTVSGDKAFEVVEYQKKRIDEGKNLGRSLGFQLIDDWTGGIRPGHLALLAALPKRQKTWFGIKAWLAQALAGENPAFFTLELSKEELVGRILCLMSRVPYSRYYRGQLLPHEWKAIEGAAEEFASFGGAIIQAPFGNRFVPSLLLEAERHNATSIIVDQFSYLQWTGNHFKENEGYKEIVYDIKNSALLYDIPWYVIAQLNRQAVADDEFPVAQHLGLTRALEEASDLIMGIKSNDALKEEHQVMLGVIEARHCESGPNARWVVEHDFYNSTKFEIHEV